jgi:hypothetical protein
MDLPVTAQSGKPQVYQAVGKNGPGRYYYISTKKLVPGQTLKGGEVNPAFDLSKYEVVSKPERASAATRPRVNYDKLRESVPGVVKRLTLLEINNIALRQEWKLSARCQRALCIWGKSRDELLEMFSTYKEQHPDCNYLDYDPTNNEFIVKWRKPSASEDVPSP